MFAASYCANRDSLAGLRAAPSRSATNRSAASLLFPRNVFTAVDERPQQCGVVAGLERSGVLDGRITVAPEDRFDDGAAAHGRAWIRLPAGLVAGWKEHRLRFVSERRHGIVAAGFGFGKMQAIDQRRRGERGAPLVAGRKTDRFCFDRVQQAISYFSRGRERRKTRQHRAANGRNKERSAALLKQRV